MTEKEGNNHNNNNNGNNNNISGGNNSQQTASRKPPLTFPIMENPPPGLTVSALDAYHINRLRYLTTKFQQSSYFIRKKREKPEIERWRDRQLPIEPSTTQFIENIKLKIEYFPSELISEKVKKKRSRIQHSLQANSSNQNIDHLLFGEGGIDGGTDGGEGGDIDVDGGKSKKRKENGDDIDGGTGGEENGHGNNEKKKDKDGSDGGSDKSEGDEEEEEEEDEDDYNKFYDDFERGDDDNMSAGSGEAFYE